MKKQITYTLFLIGLVVNGQITDQTSTLRYGIKAGYNSSYIANIHNTKFLGLGEGEKERLGGFHVGAYVKFKLDDDWYFRPELLYSIKGIVVNGEDFKSQYITMPLDVQYYPFENNGFNLDMGLFMAYALQQFKPIEENRPDIEPRKFDIGLMGGIGYTFDDHWDLNLRVQGSAMSVQDNKHRDRGRNQLFQVSVGYTL